MDLLTTEKKIVEASELNVVAGSRCVKKNMPLESQFNKMLCAGPSTVADSKLDGEVSNLPSKNSAQDRIVGGAQNKCA